jgi:hypothetical protein
MIELLLATALSCSDAQDLIDSARRSKSEYKEDIIKTIKLNTEPGCYEGSEYNS